MYIYNGQLRTRNTTSGSTDTERTFKSPITDISFLG